MACCVEGSCAACGGGVSRVSELFLPEEHVPSIPSVRSRLALRRCATTGAHQAGGFRQNARWAVLFQQLTPTSSLLTACNSCRLPVLRI
jgi:hypothetical protein